MRAPKGFGKRYFTLSAIQAYSGSVTLHRSESRTQAHHRSACDECDEETVLEEDDPVLILESTAAALPGSSRRACHCNLHFHRLACRRLRSHDRPKRFVSPYRYIRSTLSPPLLSFRSHTTTHYFEGNQ